MPQRRMIDERVFHNPVLQKLPISATVLWIGMIVISDDKGMVNGDIKALRRRLVGGRKGVRRDDVGCWLGVMKGASMLDEVIINGHKYFQIKNFFKYQHLRSKEGRNKGRETNASPSGSADWGQPADAAQEGKKFEPKSMADYLAENPEAQARWDAANQRRRDRKAAARRGDTNGGA